jgi:hypothetical protein
VAHVRLLFYFLNYFSIKIWRKGRDEKVELFEKERFNQTRVDTSIDPYIPNIKMSRRGRAMSLPINQNKTLIVKDSQGNMEHFVLYKIPKKFQTLIVKDSQGNSLYIGL